MFAKLKDQYPDMGTGKKNADGSQEEARSDEVTDSEPGSDEDDVGDDPIVVAERKKRRANRKQRRIERTAALAEAADRAQFNGVDDDGDGLISEKELAAALSTMGYTPLKQLMDEIYAEVDKDGNRSLDLDEFFDFTLISTQREGFSQENFNRLRRVFEQVDVDDSGEINALELAGLFRQMGYRSTLDEIHVFVQKVDVNGSNQLDFREFLRLMRLHREDELNNILKVFKEYQEKDNPDEMKKSNLGLALSEMGQELPADISTSTLPKVLDFDAFVDICDKCRKELVARERKKAGFTDEQLANFQELYNRFDADRSGEIDNLELVGVLQEFGWAPESREAQKILMDKIDAAREKAREAGIKEVGEAGCITFWVFIQLARTLETEKEQEEEARLESLMEQLGFSQREVDDFRHVFLERKREFGEDLAAEGGPEPRGLNRDVLRRVIRSLGVAIVGDNKGKLDTKLAELGVSDEFSQMDFAGFLLLMKWILDTNFAGVSEATAAQTSGKKK